MMFQWWRGKDAVSDETEKVKATPDEHCSSPLLQSSLYDYLSPDKKVTLQLLKEQIQESDNFCNLYEKDVNLLRFLRARNFDLGKATLMMQESLKWRKEYGVDRIAKVEKFPFAKELCQYYPRGFHGIDKKGRPIYIDCLGKLQLVKALNIAEKDVFLRRYIQEYEFLTEIILPSCSVLAGKTVEQTFSVIDLRGFSLSMFNMTTKRYVSDMIVMSQNNYPEVLGEMCVIGISKFFHVIWTFLKTLLDERTVSKIRLFTSNGKWREYLLERIDADQLPRFLGGMRDCDDTWTNMDFGPWVDPGILHEIYRQNCKIPQNLFYLGFSKVSEKDFDDIFRYSIKRETKSPSELQQPVSGDVSDSSETTNEPNDFDRVV